MTEQRTLRERIDAALQESIDRCSRCKACDTQVDAVMAVLAVELGVGAAEQENARAFCALCGSVCSQDFGQVIGICLDAPSCRRRSAAVRRAADARDAALAEVARLRTTLSAPAPSPLSADAREDGNPPATGSEPRRPQSGPPPSWVRDWDNPEDAAYDRCPPGDASHGFSCPCGYDEPEEVTSMTDPESTEQEAAEPQHETETEGEQDGETALD